ncbi:MAG: response regulator [Blastocatellia bacterium]
MDNSGITILNVDGSETGLCAKSHILREAGYRVIEARTGAETLRLALCESPQLVLLSADLPDWNGFEAMGRIKTDATLSSQSAPPLVLLVSATFVGCEKRARALEEGADGYLLEPAPPEFLLANIKMLLRRRPSVVDVARSLADEQRRGRALESLARLALDINSAESLDEILQIAAREARDLIGAHQAMASLNPDALDSIDLAMGADWPEALGAVSLSGKYAQGPGVVSDRRCETWLSSLVCRMNQPMRLTQAELELQFDYPQENDKTYGSYESHCHLHALEGVVTRRELAMLRQMACLREIAGLHEVATPREIAGLRKVVSLRNPQILRGVDMCGWLAAPLTSRSGVYERNLGLIQLSDKYDDEFTEQDETTLAQFAQIVSIAIENRLRFSQEQKLREVAKDAALAKDEFMAMTSYKLRAQLNTLLGWSWVLRRQADDMEDVTRAAEIIERAARTQARLVEDLLGVSLKGAAKWREWVTEGQREGEMEGWEDGEMEGQEAFSRSPSLRPSVPLSLYPSVSPSLHNSASRGVAAGDRH